MDEYRTTHGNRGWKYSDFILGHEMFIWEISNSPAHIIATVLVKEGVVYQQPFYDHYFMTALRLNNQHRFRIVKQQVGQFRRFYGQRELSQELGFYLMKWCKGHEPRLGPALKRGIKGCRSESDLLELMAEAKIDSIETVLAFSKRWLEL
ncbi:MAG: hypothetical protein ICV65_04130, partial [Flavisolibacter sp.]|nr:hypothetical protein [Flavisolibacter sp.]